MDLRHVRLDDPIAAPLLAGLTEEYLARYQSADELGHHPADEFLPPAGTFVVLVVDGEVVAGGGIRPLDAVACEVKRMWTHPDQRRKGYAATVLRALEDAAREKGYVDIRLETGPLQPEAQAMYDALGYHRIPVFGRYPTALAFERSLTDRS